MAAIASGILIVIPIAIILLITSSVIYLIVYRSRINKRLAEGHTGGKPMMSPFAFIALSFICITLVSFLIISGLTFGLTKIITSSNHNGFGKPMLASVKAIHTEEIEDTPFSGYTPGGELKGYDRYEATDGDVTFYYYIVKQNMQGILPRLIISPKCDKYEDYSMITLFSHFSDNDRRLDINSPVDNGGLFTVDCDGFEGNIIFDIYYFSLSQETLVSRPDNNPIEELMTQAEIKGHFSIDMSYPQS